MDLKYGPATTAPHGSLPFRISANLEPLCSPIQAAVRFLRVLIPASPTDPLAGHLPCFDAMKLGQGIRLTTFPYLPTRLDFVTPVRLASVSPPVALATTCSYLVEEQPATYRFG